jgi:hypothetical protein
MKWCSLCERHLPLGSFYPNRHNSSGRRSGCRECLRRKQREYDADCRRLGIKRYAKHASAVGSAAVTA